MRKLEILDLLPADLLFEVIEDITAKVNLQSALARKQLRTRKILEEQTRQGERTDLIPQSTCTPDGVQVRSRRESCTEKVAALYGESAGAMRARVTVYEHAQADPVKYGKYLRQMDEENSPYRAYSDLKAAQQAEHFDNEIVPQKITSWVQRGDLWKLGSHRLLCGDATNAADVNRLLAGVVPPLMVTDPPYGVGYKASWRKNIGDRNLSKMGVVSNDDRHDWSDAWALFLGDIAYVWFSGRHAASAQLSLEKHQLMVRNLIVWDKTRPVISRGSLQLESRELFLRCERG
jgi:hypothetical protein